MLKICTALVYIARHGEIHVRHNLNLPEPERNLKINENYVNFITRSTISNQMPVKNSIFRLETYFTRAAVK